MSARAAAANANRQRHEMICSGSLGVRPRGTAGAAAVPADQDMDAYTAAPPLAVVGPGPPAPLLAVVPAPALAADELSTGDDADAGGVDDEPVITGLYYDYCLALLHGYVKCGLHHKAKGANMKSGFEKLSKMMVEWCVYEEEEGRRRWQHKKGKDKSTRLGSRSHPMMTDSLFLAQDQGKWRGR